MSPQMSVTDEGSQPKTPGPEPVGLPALADVLGRLPPQVREVVEQQAGDNSQMMSIFAAAYTASAYTGPLPPPEQLRGYENVLPGSADRILKLAENQAAHRQHIEKVAVEGGDRRSWWGLALGFVISASVLGLGAALVLEGHDAAGAAFVGIDVVGLGGVFVAGQRGQSKERVQKDRQTHSPPRGASAGFELTDRRWGAHGPSSLSLAPLAQ